MARVVNWERGISQRKKGVYRLVVRNDVTHEVKYSDRVQHKSRENSTVPSPSGSHTCNHEKHTEFMTPTAPPLQGQSPPGNVTGCLTLTRNCCVLR